MTSRACAAFHAAGAKVIQIDTGASAENPLIYHTIRAAKHLLAVASLISNRIQRDRTVYIGGAGGLGLYYQATVCLIARFLGYRIVFHHHSYAYLAETTSRPMKVLCRCSPTAMHVTLCSCMSRELTERYGVTRIVEVSNRAFVEPRPNVTRPQLVGRALRLVLVSNLSRDKGLEDAYLTASELHRRGVAVELHLVGPVVDRKTHRLIETFIKDDRFKITATGPVSGSRVQEILESADIFLFPSRYRNEADPLVVHEALTAGCHVVAFARGCLKEVLPTRSLVPLEADFPTSAAVRICEVLERPSELTSLWTTSLKTGGVDSLVDAVLHARE